MKSNAIKAIVERINLGSSFLVTSHVNPEGDAIGSQIAVGSLLRKLGKKYELVNADQVPANLEFLPGADEIKKFVPDGFKPDVVIVLDCPVPARCGCVTDNFYSANTVINIDHHISNSGFGDLNWVEGDRSSVGEMIVELIEFLHIELDRDTAEQLYAAIVTDTGGFTYSNTSARTHALVSKLLKAGVDVPGMNKKLFETRSLQHVELLGKTLSTLKLSAEGRIAHITISHKISEKIDMREIPTDEFITFPRSINGVEVALFFKEFPDQDGKISVSLRSSGKVDVNAIASRFGGGGHRLAAGCTVEGPLETVKRDILKFTEKQLGKLNG